MNLLDRYLFSKLLVPLLYCVGAFIILIIVQDLFDNLSDFLEARSSLGDVLFYYLLLLPSVMVLVMPVSLLLSVLYSLLQLTKSNEITAMRASGVSIYRIIAPYALVGFTVSLLTAVVHETIGPDAAYRCHQFLEYQKHAESANITQNLAYYNNAKRRDWFIGVFSTKTYGMKNIKVTQEWPEGGARTKYVAERGQWLDGHWWLENVAIQEYNRAGEPVRQFDAAGNSLGAVRRERNLEMEEFTERPEDFVAVTKDPEYLTSREMVKFLRVHHNASEDQLARVRVDLHSRLAMPWMSFIVTLIGIPFGSQAARKGTLMGVILCISIFFGYYFFINLGLYLGKELFIPPWVAGWFPNGLFFSVAVTLLYRMR